MPLFSQTITDHWEALFSNGDVLYRDEVFTVVINPDLSEDRRLMILETYDRRVMVVLTPALADKLALSQQQNLSESVFRRKLKEAGVILHGLEYLYYFTESNKNLLLKEKLEGSLRQLTEQDDAVFSAFQSSASKQDLDEAYVELDHWAVFGSFEQNRLVSAASVYPWGNAHIADIGILTLLPFRGKGHARKVVRSISKYVYEQGYEPQYRCSQSNHASAALAKASGLTIFGKWEVISPDSTD
ncbi:GNAT family N-acetyltransferase [Sporosarcina sp. Marseille-Q4063]|uniref:GNAT family N-acetyltransferase n=1 Tax=Sporosarcina sp. Marseille-Q4063 TaxID=2810514 RepID=UPI001BAEB1B7|nr:GNAT family N-acetyltransferase [Sporosarcina sp. Marseille-Q4063]QUW23565.1 GNAT family N-acetyltransferase [Sporosarcina sp. Marseille-Q4063]